MDKNELDMISKELNDELETLDEIRQINAEKHGYMNEDELIEALSSDYEMIFKDALNNGVELEIISDENDEN